ncbi:DUF72 domain-containing protein [Geomonas sp. Red69]|uniref:DUF72 domain-containing protein n=1 Tax=Geomonas diazotrophica TaxID=2843197 RepID=UPI001C10F85D|nr:MULTISPECIES: DUF72 domain-containing protein [Geomonas]MBU5635283.1 DUF72 domain-containing protein [Geomonas diazotrophica]QXE86800.1 DUF72 domain-containing protein [Geomonas nitrogeniifigens]
MLLYIGTSGFSYTAWKGSFYPSDLPPGEMLRYYGGQFNSVEINNTFHRMPRDSVLAGWREEVPDAFRFVLKAPQRITHVNRLRDVSDAVSYFFDVAGVMGSRLGAVLFQLPPSLKKDVPLLHDFLALVPPGRRVALQFRHRSWLDDEVFALLHRNDAALCLVDVEGEPEIPPVATATWGYLRLRRPDYQVEELGKWAELVRGRGWSEAFVFFKHEDEAKGPLFARRFADLVSAG